MFKSSIGLTEVFITIQLMMPDSVQPSWWYVIIPILYDAILMVRKNETNNK